MSSSKERARLADILMQIARIDHYIGGRDERAFLDDPMLVDATERCLERMIEAVIKIGPDRMAEIAPDLPFQQLRGLGNRLRHAYDTIEAERIFYIVRHELGILKIAAQLALNGQ